MQPRDSLEQRRGRLGEMKAGNEVNWWRHMSRDPFEDDLDIKA
jgi:hypothetical protein